MTFTSSISLFRITICWSVNVIQNGPGNLAKSHDTFPLIAWQFIRLSNIFEQGSFYWNTTNTPLHALTFIMATRNSLRVATPWGEYIMYIYIYVYIYIYMYIYIYIYKVNSRRPGSVMACGDPSEQNLQKFELKVKACLLRKYEIQR